jgi:DnaJ-class molecular chaperone
MALTACPECGRRISSRATWRACPACGCPLEQCPHCNGTGRRTDIGDIFDYIAPTEPKPCPWCRGKGFVQPDLPPPDIGEIIFPD